MLTSAVATIAPRPLAPILVQPRRGTEAEGERHRFARGEEVFVEGEAAELFYKVISGTVRTSKLLNDARRQIDSFHFAGDIFGFEKAASHSVTAEAVEDTIVVAYKRASLRNLVRDHPTLADQLMSALVAGLEQAREHMLLLGRKTPREKIAMFLLDLARRLGGGDRFEFPMQRTDIADYLGLTKETVSRTLTRMHREGLIKLGPVGRTVQLADLAGLRRLNA